MIPELDWLESDGVPETLMDRLQSVFMENFIQNQYTRINFDREEV